MCSCCVVCWVGLLDFVGLKWSAGLIVFVGLVGSAGLVGCLLSCDDLVGLFGLVG